MPDIIHPTMPFSTIAFLHEQWERLPYSLRLMWSRHSVREWDSLYFKKFEISARLFNRYCSMKFFCIG